MPHPITCPPFARPGSACRRRLAVGFIYAYRPRLLAAVLVCVALLAVLALAGCGGSLPAELTRHAATAQQVLHETEAELAAVRPALEQVRAEIAALPPDDPVRRQLEAVLAQAEGVEAELEQRRADALAVIEDFRARLVALGASGAEGAEADIKAVGAAVGAGGALLPPPLNAYAALAGGLLGVVGGVVGQIQRRRAQRAEQRLRSTVIAIEAVKEPDGSLHFKDPDTEARLKVAMGPATVAAVKAIREGRG